MIAKQDLNTGYHADSFQVNNSGTKAVIFHFNEASLEDMPLKRSVILLLEKNLCLSYVFVCVYQLELNHPSFISFSGYWLYFHKRSLCNNKLCFSFFD